MAPNMKAIASGANITIQPRMLGDRVTGSRKIARSAGEVPTDQATPPVTTMATDISP